MSRFRRFLLVFALLAVVVGLLGSAGAVDRADALADAPADVVAEWDAWREAHSGESASLFAWSDIPRCAMEDGSVSGGWQPVCRWNARLMGNHKGLSFVLVDGSKVVQWRA